MRQVKSPTVAMQTKVQCVQITSGDNKTFKQLKQLLESRGIKKFKEHLLFGENLTQEFQNLHPERVIAQLISDKMQSTHSNSYTLSLELFKTLDVFGTNSPILWVKSPEIQLWSKQDPALNTELFVATGDPSNLGSLLRSAAAFEWEKIILLKECANPFHPKAVRASSGLSSRIKLHQGPSIHDLNDVENLLALDLEGESLYSAAISSPIRLLVGEEGPGIPKTLKLKKIHIPMSSKVESLNATVAASIVMSYIKSSSQVF